MHFSPAFCYLVPFPLILSGMFITSTSYIKDMVKSNCTMDSWDLQLRPFATCAHTTDVEHNICWFVSGLCRKQVSLFRSCGKKGTVMLIGPLIEALRYHSVHLLNLPQNSTIVQIFLIRDHRTSSTNAWRHTDIYKLHILKFLILFCNYGILDNALYSSECIASDDRMIFSLWLCSPIQALAASMKLFVSLQLLDLGQSVVILGRVISSSQGLYLHTNTEKRTQNTNTKHPSPEWDSNPRSRRPCERRQFMP
jgi:hypothetical protein